jgi:CRP-like cAMP-binding protein/cation transporter-like permease
MAHQELLSKIPIFESLSPDELKKLSEHAEHRKLNEGEVIFKEGDSDSTSLFIIEEGAVEIGHGEGKAHVTFTTLHEGQYFGELALFDGHPRSATATAIKPATLMRLEREDFVDFIKKNPAAAISVMGELGERLRHTNDLVASLTEDMQKLGGMEALDEPYNEVGFWSIVRKRGVWLSVLFMGEMLTATAMGHYEAEIARAVVLALFVPLIISSGGNSGSQGTSLIIRALALKELKLKDWFWVLRREILSGLTLGAFLGAIGFLRIVLWQYLRWTDYGEHYLKVALTVWASLIGVVGFGTLAGSMLPFILRRLGLDPATSSAPFVATLVDVTGLIIYFTVASIILRGTIL